MLELLANIIVILFIYLTIGFLWRAAEKILYNEVTPRVIDDVVAIILAISLFANFK